MPKYTTKEIIEQFQEARGDIFDYSLVDYVHSQTKVKIICRTHGVFEQLVNMHRKGQGCAKCMYDDKRSSASDVIAKFKAVHGERYDYSLVDYKNADSKVTIKCAEHGYFKQTPYHHMSGNGCPKCIGRHKSEEDIIELFIQVHGNKYNYSKVKFSRVNDKVDITCEEHGIFSQTVSKHISGQGCMHCAVTIGHTKNNYVDYCDNFNGKTHLYLIECVGNNELFYKVGISRMGADNRFNSKGKLPYSFKIIKQVYGSASLIWDLEKSIHNMMSGVKYKPKLSFHGKTECFSAAPSPILKLLDNFNESDQLMFLV